MLEQEDKIESPIQENQIQLQQIAQERLRKSMDRTVMYKRSLTKDINETKYQKMNDMTIFTIINLRLSDIQTIHRLRIANREGHFKKRDKKVF